VRGRPARRTLLAARVSALLSVTIALCATHGGATAGTTITVTDGGDDATCSGFYNLRCAINYANAPGNTFTNIRFATDVPAVLLQGSLPTITGNGTWIAGYDLAKPRLDGAFWSGPTGSAITIAASDVTISNLSIVDIPADLNGDADIAITSGHDTTIADDYLGILPGHTSCPASGAANGVSIAASATGAAGSGNGAAYIYGSVISCHAKFGVVSAASYVSVGTDRSGNVAGNYIGTAGDGIHAAGNAYSGVDSVGDHVTIRSNRILFNLLFGVEDEGNGSSIDFNVISSNGSAGLLLEGGDDKQIVGNRIGTTSDGLGAAPNGADGIWILGGTGLLLDSNTIAHNDGAGIGILGSSTHALIQTGDIFGNGGLPIDLGTDGATPNGTKFPPGPDDWLHYPTITSSSGNLILGITCASCFVTVYHAIGDPATAGGGGAYVTRVLANASGEWAATLPAGMTRGDVTMSAASSTVPYESSEMSPRPPFRDGFESGNTARWSVTSN